MMAHSVEKARFNMVQQQIRPWEVMDPRVLNLMEQLPRDAFVPDAYKALAYADIEIPLAHGEHMLFPRMEARLMQALDLLPSDQVLEIGTGSAYLTACLAKLCQRVVSIDIHEDFTQSAADKLQQQGVDNVLLKSGDAFAGPLEEGPFDVIAVTGSIGTSGQAEIFRQQLRIGGRLFVVIGSSPAMRAMLITRTGDKAFSEEAIFETDIKALTNAEAPRTFEF